MCTHIIRFVLIVVVAEVQVRSIANHVRPDRQSRSLCTNNLQQLLIFTSSLNSPPPPPSSSLLFPLPPPPLPPPPLSPPPLPSLALLFSATFRKSVEKLCRDVLIDPVRIVVGDLGESNTDITQVRVGVGVVLMSRSCLHNWCGLDDMNDLYYSFIFVAHS